MGALQPALFVQLEHVLEQTMRHVLSVRLQPLRHELLVHLPVHCACA